jgi:hypothetical protein
LGYPAFGVECAAMQIAFKAVTGWGKLVIRVGAAQQ